MTNTERKVKALKALSDAMIECKFKITTGYDGDMYLEFEGMDSNIEFEGWDYEITNDKALVGISKLEGAAQ